MGEGGGWLRNGHTRTYVHTYIHVSIYRSSAFVYMEGGARWNGKGGPGCGGGREGGGGEMGLRPLDFASKASGLLFV